MSQQAPPPDRQAGPELGGYRRVRVGGDELVHYAAVDGERTIACGQVVVSEWVMVSDDRPRCGACSLEWLVVTGQVRLVRRMRTVLPPELAAPRRPLDP